MNARRALLPLSLAFACAPLLLAAAPAPARAAEGFVGILEDGRMARFQSDTLPGISPPVPLRGLTPREQIVAVGHAPGRVLGIGSSARLYVIDPRIARAYRIGPPFVQGLRGTRFSLVVAPDGRSARLLSDVGQDLLIDTATGATTVGAGMRRKDGTTTYAAVDRRNADGALVGVDVARGELVEETPESAAAPPATAPGSPAPQAAAAAPVATMSTRALDTSRAPQLTEPTSFTVDSTGSGWLIAAAEAQRTKRRNSVVQRVNLQTGAAETLPAYLYRRVRTFTSVGEVGDDTLPPSLAVRIPRRISVKGLLAGNAKAQVIVSEGGIVDMQLRRQGQVLASGSGSTDARTALMFPGVWVRAQMRTTLRASIGQTAQLRFVARDWAGNRTTVTRTVRLVR